MDVIGALVGDTVEVAQRSLAVDSALAVKRAIDRQGGDPGGCGEPGRQPYVALASLMATAAAAKQHYGRGRPTVWPP